MSGTLTMGLPGIEHPSSSNALVAAEVLTPVARKPTDADTTLVGSYERGVAFDKCLENLRRFAMLSPDWDSYGGKTPASAPLKFARDLLDIVRLIPAVPAPIVQPIDGGVFVEWKSGESLLYFEIDEDSVLSYMRSVYGVETEEDPDFDVSRARQAVVRFIQEAA